MKRKNFCILIALVIILCGSSACILLHISKNADPAAEVSAEDKETEEAAETQTEKAHSESDDMTAESAEAENSSKNEANPNTAAYSGEGIELPEIEITDEMPADKAEEAISGMTDSAAVSEPVQETDGNGIRVHENGDIELPELP